MLLAQEGYHLTYLLIGDERSLYPGRFLISLRIKKHIPLAQKLLCPVHIQDGP